MEEEKNYAFFRFEDLRIYHKALDYAIWVKKTTNQFPENELRCLTCHFIKSAQSIAINIAEGSGRSKGKFIYSLKTAKSSIRECVVLTTLARQLDYIDETTENYSRNELIEMTKMMGALITSLQKGSKNTEHEESRSDEFDDFN